MQKSTPKILVVDDEADMRIFVSTVVETRGFEPLTAENGHEALRLAQLESPALIILDVMMPGIDDGIQTYQKFRTDDRLSQIPIIMLSAIARKTFFHTLKMLNPTHDRRLAKPEAYMEKPPEADELIRLIDEILAGEG